MSQVINTNMASLNAQRNLNTSSMSLNTTLQRLSSGLRVNSAKDDAAGLAIATRMNAQVRGQTAAIRNANDGLSLAQTAESAIGVMTEHLQRMREIAVQSANGSNGSADRAQLSQEFTQLQNEIQRIATSTKFNGIAILDSGVSTVSSYQVGANSGETVNITTTSAISALSGTSASYTTTAITVTGTNGTAAASAIATIDTAIDELNSQRSIYGATQVRFQGIITQLSAAREAQQSAVSRIMDADYAAETASLTRSQILQQAGTAMLAQANSLPNGVMRLLQG